MEKHAKIWLDVEKIDLEHSAQMRESTDPELIVEYADAMASGANFPAVKVFRDGTKYFLADGWHRLLAIKSLKRTKIEVDIENGTSRDAVLYAIGANAEHGKRRSQADKEKAVLYLMNDPEWSKLNDAEIMRKAKIRDGGFMGKLRLKYGIKASTTKIVNRQGRLIKVDYSQQASRHEYAPQLKSAKFNRAISYAANKAIDFIDGKLLSTYDGKMNKSDMFKIRQLIVKAVSEFENQALAKSIKTRTNKVKKS